MVKRKKVIANNKNDKQEEEQIVEPSRLSDEPSAKKSKWINKQRVLVFATRGITHRDRHLMLNLKQLLPHSKSEPKMESKDPTLVINEICESRNCNKCLFFENKKRKDLYLWMSNVPDGPSAKFLVENVHTMEELKMTGNCLKGSRPLLSFDKNFEKDAHYALLKELFVQIFGIPNHHPKSQPFIDHVLSFNVLDNRIWFRNYQIVEEDGSLAEVGPRFVLNLIKIFEGSFGGPVLYSNPFYISPNKHRQLIKKSASFKYEHKLLSKQGKEAREPKGDSYKDIDKYDDVFDTIAPEQAKGLEKNIFRRVKD